MLRATCCMDARNREREREERDTDRRNGRNAFDGMPTATAEVKSEVFPRGLFIRQENRWRVSFGLSYCLKVDVEVTKIVGDARRCGGNSRRFLSLLS